MRKDPGEKGSKEMRGMSPEGSRGQEANTQPKEGAGLMHEVRKKGSNGTDSDVRGMPATEETNAHQVGDGEGWVKATIPEGEHPFDYLFEGHQFLMAGCLLLEEIDSPLEEEELEEIKKLLDPYAERIGEFYERIHRAPEEEK